MNHLAASRSRRAITHTDGYRFWLELCPHGIPKDVDTYYDYPCRCCGHAIGPLGLVGGKCEGCRS